MTKQALEVVEFKINDDVSTESFLAAIDKTKAFISSLDGFIDRSTAKREDGLWIDVVKWRDMRAAKAAAEQFGSSEDVKDFIMMIDHNSIKMQHFEIEATM
jgi:hypothetical protein